MPIETSMIDPLYGLTARIFLGLFFLAAATHKLRGRQAFTAALRGYALLPGMLLAPAALALPVAELLVGTLLLLPGFLIFASLGAALLLGLYFSAIAANLWRGRRDIDCGCSFGGSSSLLSGWHLLRLGALMALALLPLAGAVSRELAAFDLLNLAGAVIALGVLYVAADALLANHGRMAGWRNEGGAVDA
jgi:hypothetical protein